MSIFYEFYYDANYMRSIPVDSLHHFHFHRPAHLVQRLNCSYIYKLKYIFKYGL